MSMRQLLHVLILVVVEDGLVLSMQFGEIVGVGVLILVVVEDGLVRQIEDLLMGATIGLNPCCSGRWSRTANPYFGKEVGKES